MPDMWMDVDLAVTVPVNVLPLIDDTDFKSIEIDVAWNAAGMDLVWHFMTTAGVITATAVTPTTGGNYDWTEDIADKGTYKIEIPAAGGASINNDTEGFGWFTGVATGVLPWRGPTIGFRSAALNNALVDGTDYLEVDTVQIEGADATDAINAEVDTALNTAIPVGPTADSINERIATMDGHLTADYGATEKAAIDLLDDAAGGLLDIHTDVADIHTDVADLHTDVADLHTHITDVHTDVAAVDALIVDLHMDVGDMGMDGSAAAPVVGSWGQLLNAVTRGDYQYDKTTNVETIMDSAGNVVDTKTVVDGALLLTKT